MSTLRKAVFAIFVFAVSSLSGAGAQNPDAEAVLRAREAALSAGDFDTVLSLFADDAVVVSSSGRLLIGKEQVKVWVQDQIDRRQREEAGTRSAQGNKLSWAGKVYRDDWQKLGVSPLDVNQDAIIQGGKIKFFNTTFAPESGAELRAARKKGDKSAAREQLAPTGKVRVAIAVGSTANMFRAALDGATGRPRGVAVDLANALGEELGAPVELIAYDNYPDLLNGARSGVWDVTFLGRGDEARAKVMDFGPAYYRTELTYLVPAGSAVSAQSDVDRPGVRIAVAEGSATAENRQRALRNATLIRFRTLAEIRDELRSGKVHAAAASRETLAALAAELPGARVLEGSFAVGGVIAVAVPKNRPAALAYVSDFIETAKATGVVRRAFDNAGFKDAAVAPVAARR